MDKIERQIKRYKNRLRQHKPAGHHNTGAIKMREEILEAEGPAVEELTDAAPPARVVQTNELVAKRMTPEEAVLQMNLIEEPFLVFTNANTGHVAVLYRREAGTSYGLIDARPAT